jgi:hypothetical protein
LTLRSQILFAAFMGLALLLAMAAVSPAHATLGETADSVAADAASLNAIAVSRTLRPALNAPSVVAYTVAQMTTASGTAVNEYVGPDGKVFAASWRGRRPPDLSVLLGSYFAQYQEAAIAAGLGAHGLHHASVRGSDVVVEMAGHMRDMSGRAFLPSMLPHGVEPSEIR